MTSPHRSKLTLVILTGAFIAALSSCSMTSSEDLGDVPWSDTESSDSESPDPQDWVYEGEDTLLPPTLVIEEPSEGAVVAGLVVIRASIPWIAAPGRAAFTLDDERFHEDETPPYHAVWDASTAEEGEHVLSVTAEGADHEVMGASVHVVVDRTPPGLPTVLAPPAESYVDEVFTMELVVVDTVGVAEVSARVGELSFFDDSPPWAIELDLADRESGSFEVELTARDFAGNLSHGSWSLVLDRPPVARLVTPFQDALWGPTSIYAVVGDPEGASFVQAEVDASVVEELALSGPGAEPWAWTLDASDFARGTHELTLRVRDEHGQTAVDTVSFEVDRPLELSVSVCDEVGVCRPALDGTRIWGTPMIVVFPEDDEVIDTLTLALGADAEPIALSPPFEMALSTEGFPDAPLVLRAGVTNESGDTAETVVTLLVRNVCDVDHDGVDALDCAGTDCDDDDANTNPGALDFVDGLCQRYGHEEWTAQPFDEIPNAPFAPPRLAAFSPEGDLVVLAGRYSDLWLVKDGPSGWAPKYVGGGRLPGAIGFAPDGSCRVAITRQGAGNPVTVVRVDSGNAFEFSSFNTGDDRRVTSLAWAPDGSLHALILDGTFFQDGHELFYAHLVDGTWHEVPVPAPATWLDGPQLAIGGEGTIHVVYRVVMEGRYAYTSFADDTWTPVVFFSERSTRRRAPSLVATQGGGVVVAYVEAVNERLRVATMAEETWEDVVVGEETAMARFPFVVSGPGDAVHLAFLDLVSSQLHVASKTSLGWATRVVDTEPYLEGDMRPLLLVGPAQGLHALYIRGTVPWGFGVAGTYLASSGPCLEVADGGDRNCDGVDGMNNPQ